MNAVPTTIRADAHLVAGHGIAKRFGRSRALDGLDLTVPDGAFYALVGPNGAGKTTLLRTVLGLERVDAGWLKVFGLEPAGAGAASAIRANVGYVAESADLPYRWMTVGDLIAHHAAYYEGWDTTYATTLVRKFAVDVDRRNNTLSKGEARRVQLVLALAHRPSLLLLDEPTDGFDPVMRDDFFGLLTEHLSESPTSVIVSTHLVHEIDRLADHVGILREGRMVVQTPRDRLRDRLRRYTVEIPEGWSAPSDWNGAVIQRSGSGREAAWTIWGDVAETTAGFTASGARVRDASALSLEDATLAFLRTPEHTK